MRGRGRGCGGQKEGIGRKGKEREGKERQWVESVRVFNTIVLNYHCWSEP